MHTPVLLKEVIEILNPQPGEFFIDGTIGSGGHAVEIFEKILPKGKLLGLDLNKNNLKIAEAKILTELRIKNAELRNNLILVRGNYADLPEILKQKKLGKADGLILDLGFSSEHLESGRGFSFLKNEPLDMRYCASRINADKDAEQRRYISENLRGHPRESAAAVVNNRSEEELAEIFWKYGEERFSRQIARKIIEERKRGLIKTTFDLIQIIKKSVPKNYERSRIHPATRVFQALRIYVNNELDNLEKLLKNLDKIVKGRTRLRPRRRQGYGGQEGFGGQVAIISYHSLEDRLVKDCFRNLKNQGKAQILTKKPIRPTNEEIKSNPRSRSAKLRAIIYDHYSTK